MKFIKSSEISGKIMSLIEESDEFVILVSPYVKISKWYKLLKKIDGLKSRNVPFQFVIREGESNANSAYELDALNYKYKAIPDLHAKVYLNEKYAIVSSFNLLLSSDINTIETGYQSETPEEYAELVDFCKRHLSVSFTHEKSPQRSDIPKHWLTLTKEELIKIFKRPIIICYDEITIQIDTGKRQYDCYIWNTKTNIVRMAIVLSSNEYQKMIRNIITIEKLIGNKIEHYPNSFELTNKIYINLFEDFNSQNLKSLSESEIQILKTKLIEVVTCFERNL